MRSKKPFIPTPPQKSCGKNRYNSKEEADTVAREQEVIFSQNDLKLKSYRCSSCGGWHLTKTI
jgi:hypothetical protein